MKGSCPCIKGVLRLLTVVLCSLLVMVMVSGCGSKADPAAIGKEWKDAKAELTAAGTDAKKKEAAEAKVKAAEEKYNKLTADQKKEADKTKM